DFHVTGVQTCALPIWIRYAVLYPLIIVTSLIGAYSVKNSMLSVWIVIAFGFVGYAMKRLNLPVAPLVLGLVIGPLFETALVQTRSEERRVGKEWNCRW